MLIMTNSWRLLTIALLVACSFHTSVAHAQTYPTRAISIIVPFSAGGPVDAMARLVASKMSGNIGQPVVVVNRAGASGVIGIDAVARAEPDGYTILYAPISIAIGPALYRKLPFDPLRQLAPVTQIVSTTLVLAAHPKVPVSSVKELIALAKAKPGSLNFGSSGIADPLQLGMELLKTSAGVEMLAIQYKGQGPMLAALLGGEVDVAIVSLQGSLALIRSGALRVLAVTGAKRSVALPGVPTVAESGFPGFDISSWHGMFAPAGTPREIINRIQREAARAVNSPDIRERVQATGNETVGGTPEEFDAKFRADVANFIRIVKDAHIPNQD